VQFSTPEEAQHAIEILHDSELDGRPILVREDREAGKGGGGGAAGCQVYVGNLSWKVAWQDLKDHCKQAGTVVHADVMMEPDGRSKGCGIVQFSTPEEAQHAIEILHDSELDGRPILVREDREAGKGGRSGEVGSTVYVGNLSWKVAWQDLKDHCKQAGTVVHADVMMEPDGRSKGCGIVQFSSPQEAQAAIEMLHDSELDGRLLLVREDREAGNGRGGGQAFGDTSPAGGPGCKIYVGNLTFETTWMNLKDTFREAGNVLRAEVITDNATGKSKGFGTVLFSTTREAAKAIQLFNDSEYDGRLLDVRPDAFAGQR